MSTGAVELKWSRMLQEELAGDRGPVENHVMLSVRIETCLVYVNYYLVLLQAKDAMSADYTLLL